MSLLLSTDGYNAHYSYSSCSTDSAVFEQDDSPSHCPLSPVPSALLSAKPETVSKAVESYMRAAKNGRSAYMFGDVKLATEELDKALGIELDVETECLFDTTVGVVSGLVRKEVEERLGGKSLAPSCSRILKNLRNKYKEAEKKLKSKPGEAKWYLKMGAAFCCVNQWDSAKAVYRRGMELCKDNKALRTALQRLTELDDELTMVHPFTPVEPRGCVAAELTASAENAVTRSLEAGEARTNTLPAPSSLKTMRKRFSLLNSRKKVKKVLRTRSQIVDYSVSPSPEACLEQAAATTFDLQSAAIVSSIDFTPSVILLLRRLSVVSPETLKRISNYGTPTRTRFASAPPAPPLIIDSDDSELDD